MIKQNQKIRAKINSGAVIDQPGCSKDYLTGAWRNQRPIWNSEKCIHCGLCKQNCPEDCIIWQNNKRGKTDLKYCKGCGICAQVCPVKAIQMKDEKKDKTK